MSLFKVKLLELPTELLASEKLCQSSYQKKYGFDYREVKQFLPKYPNKVSFGYFNGDVLVSSISGTFAVENVPLPSEVLFDFKIPARIHSEFQLMEIGRLCKDYGQGNGLPTRFEDFHKLLQHLVAYAKEHNVDYVTASLHPSISFVLCRLFKIPFEVFFTGQPKINTGNVDLLKHTGTYADKGLAFVGISISKIQNALVKINL